MKRNSFIILPLFTWVFRKQCINQTHSAWGNWKWRFIFFSDSYLLVEEGFAFVFL